MRNGARFKVASTGALAMVLWAAGPPDAPVADAGAEWRRGASTGPDPAGRGRQRRAR